MQEAQQHANTITWVCTHGSVQTNMQVHVQVAQDGESAGNCNDALFRHQHDESTLRPWWVVFTRTERDFRSTASVHS